MDNSTPVSTDHHGEPSGAKAWTKPPTTISLPTNHTRPSNLNVARAYASKSSPLQPPQASNWKKRTGMRSRKAQDKMANHAMRRGEGSERRADVDVGLNSNAAQTVKGAEGTLGPPDLPDSPIHSVKRKLAAEPRSSHVSEDRPPKRTCNETSSTFHSVHDGVNLRSNEVPASSQQLPFYHENKMQQRYATPVRICSPLPIQLRSSLPTESTNLLSAMPTGTMESPSAAPISRASVAPQETPIRGSLDESSAKNTQSTDSFDQIILPILFATSLHLTLGGVPLTLALDTFPDEPQVAIEILQKCEAERDRWFVIAALYRRRGNYSAAVAILETLLQSKLVQKGR